MIAPLELVALLATDFSPAPEFNRNFGPYGILMALGFAVGVFGHLIRSNLAIGSGIAMVMMGAVVLPVLVHLL